MVWWLFSILTFASYKYYSKRSAPTTQEFAVFGWSWSKIEQCGNPSPTSTLPSSSGKSLWMPAASSVLRLVPMVSHRRRCLLWHKGSSKRALSISKRWRRCFAFWAKHVLRQHLLDLVAPAWTLCFLLHPQEAEHQVGIRTVADTPSLTVVVDSVGPFRANIPLNITVARSADDYDSEMLSVRITVPRDGDDLQIGTITGATPSDVTSLIRVPASIS
jgi:hypothetical protein